MGSVSRSFAQLVLVLDFVPRVRSGSEVSRHEPPVPLVPLVAQRAGWQEKANSSQLKDDDSEDMRRLTHSLTHSAAPQGTGEKK